MIRADTSAMVQLVTMPAEPVLADLLAKNKMRYRLAGNHVKQAELLARLPRAWMTRYMTEWRDVSGIVSVRRHR